MPNSTNMNTSTILTGTTVTAGINTITVPNPYLTSAPYYSTATSNSSNYITSSSNYAIGATGIKPTDLITLHSSGKEIVKVTVDGEVKWANGINVDEAAEAFSKSVTVGSEIAAGITQRVKSKMRDSMFEDLINIAKDKGSLTAEDLTYLLQASKMMEKLKGKFDE